MGFVTQTVLGLLLFGAGQSISLALELDTSPKALNGTGQVCAAFPIRCAEAGLQMHLASLYENVELKALHSESAALLLRSGEHAVVRPIQWTGAPSRRMTVWLDIVSGTKVWRSLPVDIEVHAYVAGWQAKADLRPTGTAMNESDLMPKAVDITAQSAVPWEGSIAAYRLRKPLLAGQVLTSSHVERVTLITRGQRVGVKSGYGDLHIEAQGQALQDGQVGDWVQVRVARSASAVLGRVTGAGTVEVMW